MKNPVTMKIIAKHAGVTEATVSMSLANNHRISVKTRQRVQAIAKKLGYSTHPYISTLLRMRRMRIPRLERPALALINAFASIDGWKRAQGPTVRQMREGAFERAAMRGYRAEEFWLHSDRMTPERLSDILYARGIQGILLSPLAEGAETPAIKWSHFAVVSLSVPLAPLAITTVCNDHFLSCLRTVRECHRLGYRRMGLVIRKIHRTRFQGRWDSGILAAQILLTRLNIVPTLLVDDWDDEKSIVEWTMRKKPEVIVSPGAEWIHPMLIQMGLKVPDDIGLAGLSCSHIGHKCSGTYQDGHAIGATAVDTLIAKVEQFERGIPERASTIMLESVWNPGHTLKQR
jgi:DNA-binding LacI/PurR family transcriptional regulator